MSALFLSAVFVHNNSFSQKKVVRLIYAETVKDVPDRPMVTQATGNVHFEHDNTHLYCDSAVFFRVNDVVYAYDNVQINQGDTVNLFCDSLKYFGELKFSKLQGNVRLRDRKYKLVTDSLEYDGNTSIGYYNNNGVITSLDSDLKLTSIKGAYHANEKTFFFKDSVRVTGDKYRMECDTLEFQTENSSAHFHGPTTIIMDSSTVECVAGVYYTQDSYVQLWDGAYLYEKGRSLYADSLIYSEDTEVGEGFCNVNMYDSTETVQFLSDYMWKSSQNDTIILKNNARVIDYSDSDTLEVLADSIFQYEDTVANKYRSIAQTNVGIISGDLTVRCDSAYFSEIDSIIKFYYNPIMWSEETQMSSDTIFAEYYDNEFHKLYMYSNCFIATEHDTIHYDQIKGKFMTAWLDSSKIQKVFIELNAETLYYLSEEETDSLGNKEEVLNGMNRIDCNEIWIRFVDSEIDKISFIEEPNATFYPMEQIPAKELYLKGFLWQIGLKPKSGFTE